jgi:hypothetical protein
MRARAIAVVAVALGLPASAHAADPKPPPQARAAGGDVVELTYPSIVMTHVKRAERAMDRAAERLEDDEPERAARPLKVVRRQMAAAWRGAKYKIRTAPPPPASEDRVNPRARRSGDGPTGPTYASPADTGFRVLTLQHDVAADTAQLLADAPEASLGDVGNTMQFALDRRDKALEDIVALAPPAPAGDDEEGADEARLRARASGDGPTVTTFETVMPNVVPQLDDELDVIAELTSETPDPTDSEDAAPTELTAGARSLLDAAGAQIERTKAVVNKQWPPIPTED